MFNMKIGRLHYAKGNQMILVDADTNKEVACYNLQDKEGLSFQTIVNLIKKEHMYTIVNLKKVGGKWMLI